MSKNSTAEIFGRQFDITFDSEVYSLKTIKLAALKFANRGSFDISKQENKIVVSASLDEDSDLEQLKGDFRNQVLNQDLRAIVAQETQDLRNIILANAFSKTSLVEK